jgi:hypothetical protein
MTCFLRKILMAAMVSAGLAGSTGCLIHTAPPADVDRSPLVIDEAMQHRDWPVTVAHYANGETPAYPTGFVLQHSPTAPAWTPVLTDTPLFFANIVAMPIGYIFTPPWTPVAYPEGVVPPSYNVMPAYPPPLR